MADTFLMPYQVQIWGVLPVNAEQDASDFARAWNSGSMGNGAGYISAANAEDGDYITWTVSLAAGTYALTWAYLRDTDKAIIYWDLDTTNIASQDTYGTYLDDQVVETTGITVASDGSYTLKARINGKNASSSDYGIGIQWACLTRTGA